MSLFGLLLEDRLLFLPIYSSSLSLITNNGSSSSFFLGADLDLFLSFEGLSSFFLSSLFLFVSGLEADWDLDFLFLTSFYFFLSLVLVDLV